MKMVDGVKYLTIGEVSTKIRRGIQTIKVWYDWAEKHGEQDQLPPTFRDLDEKGTRFFKEDDIPKLVEFRDTIRYGQMAEFSRTRWGNRYRNKD